MGYAGSCLSCEVVKSGMTFPLFTTHVSNEWWFVSTCQANDSLDFTRVDTGNRSVVFLSLASNADIKRHALSSIFQSCLWMQWHDEQGFTISSLSKMTWTDRSSNMSLWKTTQAFFWQNKKEVNSFETTGFPASEWQTTAVFVRMWPSSLFLLCLLWSKTGSSRLN